jgi:hypothetical protein
MKDAGYQNNVARKDPTLPRVLAPAVLPAHADPREPALAGL